MSDVAQGPASEPTLEVAEAHQAVAALSERYRRAIGQARALKFAVFSLGAAVLALAGGFVLEAARPDVVPVFVWMHRDGTVDTSESMSRLPASTQQAGIEAELWAYVWHREHYNFDDAQIDYTIVSAMSATDVRKRYQDQTNAQSPNAPVRKYGRALTIDIDPASGGGMNVVTGDYYEHTADYSAGVYHIRYRAFTHQQGKPDTCQRLAVTLRYAPMDAVPLYQRKTFNPQGIVILDYPSPQLESVLPTKDCL